MPKRQRYDWANQPDPETGEPTRFCTRCKAFLTLDRFYKSTLNTRLLRCRTHTLLLSKEAKNRYSAKKRGLPTSVSRIRTNLNMWIYVQKKGWAKWTDADVEQALKFHNVDLSSESRRVRFRPRDKSLPFTVDNSVVSFFNSTKSKSGSGNGCDDKEHVDTV